MTDYYDQAARLRDELTDELIADGKITSPLVERRFAGSRASCSSPPTLR